MKTSSRTWSLSRWWDHATVYVAMCCRSTGGQADGWTDGEMEQNDGSRIKRERINVGLECPSVWILQRPAQHGATAEQHTLSLRADVVFDCGQSFERIGETGINGWFFGKLINCDQQQWTNNYIAMNKSNSLYFFCNQLNAWSIFYLKLKLQTLFLSTDPTLSECNSVQMFNWRWCWRSHYGN